MMDTIRVIPYWVSETWGTGFSRDNWSESSSLCTHKGALYG